MLIDFGAVKDQVSPLRADASEQTALTQYAIGTPGYAPPEQMAMRPVYASDLYAVGVTCLYLLTARSPKDMDYDPSTGEVLWRQQVHVSDHFAEVLKKMLEVSVRHRYQNATEVLRALDLEPYLDSLARGMSSQPNRTNADRNSSERTETTTSSLPSSPSARMAAAIRARANKSETTKIVSDATRLQPGAPLRRSLIQSTSAATSSRNPVDTHSQSSVGQSSVGQSSVGRSGAFVAKPAAADLQMSYAKGKRDFTCHDLSLLILQKFDLSGANFHQSKLHKSNLQGANLKNADFGRASLSQATLRNANLARAYLSHADLAGADLRGADLSYAYLSHANLRGANLCGADLTGAKITDEQLATARTNWATIHPSGKRGLW